MALTVIGIFDDATEAQQAVDALVNAGISRNRIDVSAGRYAESDTTMPGAIPDRHANTSGTRTEVFVNGDYVRGKYLKTALSMSNKPVQFSSSAFLAELSFN